MKEYRNVVAAKSPSISFRLVGRKKGASFSDGEAASCGEPFDGIAYNVPTRRSRFSSCQMTNSNREATKGGEALENLLRPGSNLPPF